MSSPAVVPMIGSPGPQELILILLVLVLLFGAKKLPELARGSGRALRIFKAETKGLLEDEDDDPKKTAEQKQIDAQRSTPEASPVQEVRQVEDPVEQPRPESDR